MPDENATSSPEPALTPALLHKMGGLSSFGLFCALGAGTGFSMAIADLSDLESGREFYHVDLFGCFLYLKIALVSCVGLLLMIVTPAAKSGKRQTLDLQKFLLFGWLCVLFINVDVQEVVRIATEELPPAALLLETQERILSMVLLIVGALVITAYSLHLVRRAWEKLGTNQSLLWLVARVCLANFLGFLLACGMCFPLDYELDYVGAVASILSNAVAIVVWSALLLLAFAGMTKGIAQRRASAVPPGRDKLVSQS